MSSEPVDGLRTWRGIPGAERAATRRTLLIDAAFDLLGTEGWGAVTVRGVCRQARLNPRYFYQSFADLDDLLVAVFDRVIADMLDAIDGAIGQPGVRAGARARAGLEAIARFVAEDRRRARVLYSEALGHEGLNRRRVETMQQFVDLLVPGERPDRAAAEVAAHIAVGGFTNALVAWLDGRLAVGLDELVDHAAVILIAAGRAAGRIESRH